MFVSAAAFNRYRSGHYLWSGWGLKRKCYVHSKKFYPTICLSQIFFTPPKKNSAFMLKFGIYFTLLLSSKIILPPHLTQVILFSYPIILSSVPTPVINNDRFLHDLQGKIQNLAQQTKVNDLFSTIVTCVASGHRPTLSWRTLILLDGL